MGAHRYHRRVRCPDCGFESSHVVDSRPSEEGVSIRRRRECEECSFRFTTYERADHARRVRKRNGQTERFDPAKLTSGLRAALAERPVTDATISQVVHSIESEVLSGVGVIDSAVIGSMVMNQLRDVDTVGYLRFASVYEDFEGVADFEQALADLGEPVEVGD